MEARAVIAEDEPVLAITLEKALLRLWPELRIVDTAPNGIAVVESVLAQRPDVVFLDIRMPGQTGLEAAEELADRWPDGQPFPLVVFVTAYDDYALQAFERAALDYVLKPVSDARLALTVQRLRQHLAQARGGADAGLARLAQQLAALLPGAQRSGAQERLDFVRAAVGNVVRMIPVEDVVYFQALDKYVNVVTSDGEALIRTSLKDLRDRLDPARFRQVSRATIVNLPHVASAARDDSGRLVLALHGRDDRIRVGPLYAHLFRQM